MAPFSAELQKPGLPLDRWATLTMAVREGFKRLSVKTSSAACLQFFTTQYTETLISPLVDAQHRSTRANSTLAEAAQLLLPELESLQSHHDEFLKRLHESAEHYVLSGYPYWQYGGGQNITRMLQGARFLWILGGVLVITGDLRKRDMDEVVLSLHEAMKNGQSLEDAVQVELLFYLGCSEAIGKGTGYPFGSNQAVETPAQTKSPQFSKILHNIKMNVVTKVHVANLAALGMTSYSGTAAENLCLIAYENISKGGSLR
eukprot:sb/3468493/